MSMETGPAAVTSTAGGLLELERIVAVHGIAAGFRQPSLRAVVRVNASDALDARFDEVRQGCKLDRVAGPIERLPAGEHWVRLLGNWALSLLRDRRLPVFDDCAVSRMDRNTFLLSAPTVGGLHRAQGRLMRLLCQQLNLMAANTALQHGPGPSAIDQSLEGMTSFGMHDKNTMPLLATAHRLGIPWRRLTHKTYALGTGSLSRWIQSSLTDRSPGISISIARNKIQAARLLRANGLPASSHTVVASEAEAAAAAERIGYPLVVKPADQDGGRGVTGLIESPAALARAFSNARKHSKTVVLEPHFFGNDYRLHVFEGEVFRLRLRIPGGVTGDGVSTVGRLLAALNADPARGEPETGSKLVRIDMDEEAVGMLQRVGLGIDSVPEKGQFVALRSIANVSAGGVSLSVPLADAHPDNLILAKRAVGAMRLDLAAVDLLIPDIRRSWTESGALICEVNAQPQFGEDVPEWLYGRMFPGLGRVPCAVWLGSEPPGLFASVSSTLMASGIRLGLFDGKNCWVCADRWASAGSMSAADAGRLFVDCRDVDAILVVADSSLVRDGLPAPGIDALCLAGLPDEPTSAVARVLLPSSASVSAANPRAWAPVLAAAGIGAGPDVSDWAGLLTSLLSRQPSIGDGGHRPGRRDVLSL